VNFYENEKKKVNYLKQCIIQVRNLLELFLIF